MNVSMKSQKGFSLVELMVVVSIIGILAAIAIPNFQRFTAKAKQSEAKAALAAIYSAERAFHSEWQMYHGSFSVVGYKPTGRMRYEHGFAGAGPALPGGYTGPAADALINTAAFCAVAANACAVEAAPIAPGTAATAGAGTPTAVIFVAGAGAHIGNAAAADIDRWTINQDKAVVNTNDGLP